MITARRSNVIDNGRETSARGGIDVLERKTAETVITEDAERMSAREKMQENLDRLMHYDRYAEREAEEKAKAQSAVRQPVAVSDDDIRPTSTTMQFGDGDTSKVYNDLERSKEQGRSEYKLNAKGKLVVALYALVVTVILALIVINTGVLKSLDGNLEALNTAYNSSSAVYQEQLAEIEKISSESRIVEIAENDYGMIIK